MTNPTSNYGWVMPTSSSLVTNLPADFNTFGQAVDTSLAELKGGTTGQVLSKTSNTDMDFTWVAQDDANAIQNAIVDAKGDLIAASANDTPARLAVGANGTTLVADSTAATGLKWAAAPDFVGCRIYAGANQSIATATSTAINFNNESFDTNTFHDNSTNNTRITIPTGYGGKYLIQGSIRWNPSALGRREITVNINGGGSLATGEASANASAFLALPVFTLATLSAGDYIELKTYQDSGSSLSTIANSDNTFFQIQYLGA